MDEFIPSNGLVADKEDARDFLYSDIVGAGEVEIDWEKGFNIYTKDFHPITYDQGKTMSCVAQATAMHTRAWNMAITGQDIDFSRKFIYSQISLGLHVGASLRDGVKLVSTIGDCKESSLESYENGKPPSEEYMFSQKEITDAMRKEALPFDQFNYRVIPGYTTNIDLFAHAIKNNCGVVAGFTGTNDGWCRPIIRPPEPGEAQWGHAVYLCGYGIYNGKKCVFTPNSWGGRYTIQDGPWKGYQAITEDYFLAAPMTAVGPVPGGYVFNAWVLVPDEKIKPNQKLMDFLKKNEGKLVQDVEQSGSFGLVINGEIRVADKSRITELFATYLMRKEGVPVPKNLWNDAPKKDF